MDRWTTPLMLMLAAGCVASPPTNPALPAEAPGEAPDTVTAMPPSQLKSVLDWIDYVCSLPPDKRIEAMKSAPTGYMLLPGDDEPPPTPPVGPTTAFACPN